MPKLTKLVPKYRKHRPTGQAVVTLNGHAHYLGPHGTKASHLARIFHPLVHGGH